MTNMANVLSDYNYERIVLCFYDIKFKAYFLSMLKYVSRSFCAAM